MWLSMAPTLPFIQLKHLQLAKSTCFKLIYLFFVFFIFFFLACLLSLSLLATVWHLKDNRRTKKKESKKESKKERKEERTTFHHFCWSSCFLNLHSKIALARLLLIRSATNHRKKQQKKKEKYKTLIFSNQLQFDWFQNVDLFFSFFSFLFSVKLTSTCNAKLFIFSFFSFFFYCKKTNVISFLFFFSSF